MIGVTVTSTNEFEKTEHEGWGDQNFAKGYAESFDMATRVIVGGGRIKTKTVPKKFSRNFGPLAAKSGPQLPGP